MCPSRLGCFGSISEMISIWRTLDMWCKQEAARNSNGGKEDEGFLLLDWRRGGTVTGVNELLETLVNQSDSKEGFFQSILEFSSLPNFSIFSIEKTQMSVDSRCKRSNTDVF